MKTVSRPIGLITDPVILTRDVLLDPDAVAEQIGRIWQHEVAVESCTLRRAKYRIGESLRVVYDVVADDKTFVMSARTFADSASAFRQSADATPVHGMPGIAHDPETSSVWWTVPNDRRLRNIGTLLDPPLRVRQNSGVDWQESTLVEYAPERSATVRIRGKNGQVSGYAKGYRDRDPFEVATQYNSVAASVALIDGMRTPRALGWARPDRIVVLEPMPGLPWTQLPVQSQPLAAERFGSALAHVHGLSTGVRPRTVPALPAGAGEQQRRPGRHGSPRRGRRCHTTTRRAGRRATGARNDRLPARRRACRQRALPRRRRAHDRLRSRRVGCVGG